MNFTHQATFFMPTFKLCTPTMNKILTEKNNYLMQNLQALATHG